MLRKIAVVPTDKSKGDKVRAIRDKMTGLGELEDAPANGVRLIIVDAPDGDIAEAIKLCDRHPAARIIVATDPRSGNYARSELAKTGATNISVVDCGNGGLQYEAKLLLDLLEAKESRPA